MPFVIDAFYPFCRSAWREKSAFVSFRAPTWSHALAALLLYFSAQYAERPSREPLMLSSEDDCALYGHRCNLFSAVILCVKIHIYAMILQILIYSPVLVFLTVLIKRQLNFAENGLSQSAALYSQPIHSSI